MCGEFSVCFSFSFICLKNEEMAIKTNFQPNPKKKNFRSRRSMVHEV